jgi:hypothetical protein
LPDLFFTIHIFFCLSCSHQQILLCGAGSPVWLLPPGGAPRIEGSLVDDRPPLSLTSDKSTECYRNWWPDRDAMVALMNRSIDLPEELALASGNAFQLNRRGIFT